MKKTELCRKDNGNTFPKNSKTPSRFNWNCLRIYDMYLGERERKRERKPKTDNLENAIPFTIRHAKKKKRSKMSSVTKV